MDKQDKKLVIVLFTTAIALLIGGCVSGYFIVYVWTNTVRLASAHYATDAFVAMTLFAYFVMVGFIGVALGLLLNYFTEKREPRTRQKFVNH